MVGPVSQTLFDLLLNEAVAVVYNNQILDLDSSFFTMENLGFQVGSRLVEKLVLERPRFLDQLEMVKFVCTELWFYLYHKRIDNLKTNNKGVYVLSDLQFQPFRNLLLAGTEASQEQAIPHLAYPCGLIRGALSCLGMSCSVNAEISTMPQCLFQIQAME